MEECEQLPLPALKTVTPLVSADFHTPARDGFSKNGNRGATLLLSQAIQASEKQRQSFREAESSVNLKMGLPPPPPPVLAALKLKDLPSLHCDFRGGGERERRREIERESSGFLELF